MHEYMGNATYWRNLVLKHREQLITKFLRMNSKNLESFVWANGAKLLEDFVNHSQSIPNGIFLP